jgi:hypothetical protein
MANKTALECVDQLLQDIMGNDIPLGGKLFVGVGDFRQVAPVVRGGSGPTATFYASVRSSELWSHFQILRLRTPIRNASDLDFSRWVVRVLGGYILINNMLISIKL